jgi:hypothetical protein
MVRQEACGMRSVFSGCIYFRQYSLYFIFLLWGEYLLHTRLFAPSRAFNNVLMFSLPLTSKTHLYPAYE